MSKLYRAALLGASVITYHALASQSASAQQATATSPQPAAEAAQAPATAGGTVTAASPSSQGGATSGQGGVQPALPPVVVQQKSKPAEPVAATPKPKAKPAPAAAEVDDAPPPKPKKKVVKAAPQPAPAPAAKPKPASAPVETAAPVEPPAAASGATALGTYNPALDLRGLQVPPGTTMTTAGPVNGYQALSAMSSTKTATPIEQIPQSIQVVPKSVLKDQTTLTITEATKNVSNVQAPNELAIANAEQLPVKVRGFGAEQWLDGISVLYNTGDRDAMANIERIEVLKGPNAILYGGGAGAPVGGAINIVSKLPTDRAGGEVGVTFGSNNYVRPWFDINQPLNSSATALFRITGEYKSSDSFIDVLSSENYTISPTLTLTNKTDTTLTIQGRLSRQSQQAYPGLPVTGTIVGDFRVDRHMFIGPTDMPPSHSETHGVTVTFDHKFNEIFSFNVKGRWSKSEFDQFSQNIDDGSFNGANPLFGSTWYLYNVEMWQKQQEFTINPSLQAKFEFGPTRNTVLVGGDYSRVTDVGAMPVDFLGNMCWIMGFGCPPALVDLMHPVFPIPFTRPDPSSMEYMSMFNFDNVYVTSGAYAQVQSTLYDRVHVMGGLRVANLDIEYTEKATGVPTTYTTDVTKVLPRGGIVVDMFKGVSVFASYSEGMKWSPWSTSIKNPLPEESTQFEGGIKLNLANGLSGTLAYFDIDKQNVPIRTSLGTSALSHQTSKGFEADMLWQPNRNWQVLASYGYTNVTFGDSFLDFSGGVIPAGNRVPYVPEHSGRVWVNYSFDQPMLVGWSVGAGVYASGAQFVDNANRWKTDGYFTVDAKVAYENEKFRAAFNVKNLTGEEYWVPYSWLGGQVAPGADRAYYGTFVYKY